MAVQTVTALSRAGIVDLIASAVAVDVALSDTWANTGAEFAFVAATGAGVTVTLTGGVGLKIDGITPTALTVVVGAGKNALIGPFPKKWYDNASGIATLTWSISAGVKVAIIQFPGTPSVN